METEVTRPAEMGLAERQERRFRFLHKLYESTDGNTNSLVELDSLAQALRLKSDEAASVSAYLTHEGLIQGSDWIVLTHAGVIEVEAALSKPSDPTTHFHAHIADSLRVAESNPGPASPSGRNDDYHGHPADHSDHAAMRVVIDLITGALDELALSGDLRREVVSDIASARAQLSSPRPKAIILREVLRSLHDMVEGAIGSGVAGTAAWGPILTELGQLADAIK